MQLQVKLQRNSRKNVFTSKETRSKVPSNIFRGFEVKKRYDSCFEGQRTALQDKCYVFSGYKKRCKVRLVFLERKLQKYRYG